MERKPRNRQLKHILTLPDPLLVIFFERREGEKTDEI